MDILLSEEETLLRLNASYKTKFKCDLPDNVQSAIKQMKVLAQKSPDAAEKLKIFCETTPNVRMASYEVPDHILPQGYSATLYDAKVRAKGPDDKIYNNNPNIRRRVARGTTIMELKGHTPSLDVVVYANKKFTGGMGDDDRSQPENDDIWRQYCLQPPEQALEVVCMTKLNGEAAHFSVRYIENRFYLFIGSKFNHIIIRDENDIDHYTENRFYLAKIIANTICETFAQLREDARLTLFSFLHHTKCTAVCEILQPEYQHIVYLGHLVKPEINFITFTPTASEDVESTLTALPPHHNLDLMETLGLKCVPYRVTKASEILEHRNIVRTEQNKEGEVLYYLNKRGETLGITKVKSVHYILLRALREKTSYIFTNAKKKPIWNLQEMTNSINKRFMEIQGWLKISDDCMESWKNQAEAFIKWFNEEYKKNKIKNGDIRSKFPIFWKKFLEEYWRQKFIRMGI